MCRLRQDFVADGSRDADVDSDEVSQDDDDDDGNHDDDPSMTSLYLSLIHI